MIDYPMCPTCRIADVQVMMARDVRDDCPHCGGILFESRRACCLPDCKATLPASQKLPVCEVCGIKIAAVYALDAASYDPAVREAFRELAARRERRRAELAASSVVYYVRLSDDRIKIGYTGKLKARMADLRVHPSDLLALEPGGRDVEKARHIQFAADRIAKKLEEFRPSAQLCEWIGGLRAEHDLPAWAKVPDTRVKVRQS